jgi:hypothetical protein
VFPIGPPFLGVKQALVFGGGVKVGHGGAPLEKAGFFLSLRLCQSNETCLLEVVIGSESFRHFKVSHNDKADAVGVSPVLVQASVIKLPGALPKLVIYAYHHASANFNQAGNKLKLLPRQPT